MLRQFISAKLARRRAQVAAAGVVIAFGVAAGICFGFHLRFVDSMTFGMHSSTFVALGLGLSVVWWLMTARLFVAPREGEGLRELLRWLRVNRVG
jgi:hypothetical protein